MLNDHERSVQKHPWSAKAHDPADLFTLFLLIAMHAAVAAEGLAFHKRTAVYALMCIPAKRLTFLTEALTMMLFPAVQGYHCLLYTSKQILHFIIQGILNESILA